MSQSNSSDCYTYLACLEAPSPAWIELGCTSDESVSYALQTSNLPICRKNKNIQKKIDGIEVSSSLQLENKDATDDALFRWAICALQKCKEVAIAYLSQEITVATPENYGTVIYGAASGTWTRNVGEKNLSLNQESTLGSWCWEDYLGLNCSIPATSTGDVTGLPDPTGGDVPLIPGCEADNPPVPVVAASGSSSED